MLTVLSVVETADFVNFGVSVSLLDGKHVVPALARFGVGTNGVEVDEVEPHLTYLSSETGDLAHRDSAMHWTIRVPDVLRLHEVRVVGGDFHFFAFLAGLRNFLGIKFIFLVSWQIIEIDGNRFANIGREPASESVLRPNMTRG